jgi:hypothetical protein
VREVPERARGEDVLPIPRVMAYATMWLSQEVFVPVHEIMTCGLGSCLLVACLRR